MNSSSKIRILFYDEGAQGETQLGGGQLERLEFASRKNSAEFETQSTKPDC